MLNRLLQIRSDITESLSSVMVRRFSPPMRVYFLAFVTGLLVGTAAHILKWMIGGVSHLLTSHLHANSYNLLFLILPVCGISLTYLFQRYVARRKIYHGVDRLNDSLRHKDYVLPFQLTFTPMLASTLTLGFGGSAGSEGPIAYTGAAIGSNVARGCRLDARMMDIMVACGAAAGIAGIFEAPLGGAFFALECLFLEISTVALMALMIASMTAGLMAFILSGCTPDIFFVAPIRFDMHLIWAVVALGVFCGLYSVYYQKVMRWMTARFAAMRNPWAGCALSGGIIGVSIFLFPPLYGEGYGFITHMLTDSIDALTPYGLFVTDRVDTTLILLLLGGMMIVKAFATASTTSGGGVAGEFAPSLFAGCLTGLFFAVSVNSIFHVGLPLSIFAFMGMPAVMAATQRAPLMAIFLTVEMGAAYTLLLPVVVAALISYLIFRAVCPDEVSRRNNASAPDGKS